MKFLRLLPFLFSLLYISTFAQTDSCSLRISLLTCSPGEELYSTFGHTALRVTDQAHGTDVVYNYGTFDDSDPNFYAKFTRGIMRYALSFYSYRDFLQEYQSEKRGVIEQALQLTCAEKEQLYSALQQNALEQNRYYNYYFHTDNCTTRARDMITQKTGAQVVFKNILPAKAPSYRNLIYTYLNKSGMYWSKLGIDFVLGSNFDKKVTNQQAMFLPDYLMMGFDSATANGHALVSSKQVVVKMGEAPNAGSWILPFWFFVILLLVAGFLSFNPNKWARKTLDVFDSLFFLMAGILGVAMVTLWIIRIDDVCRNNFNIVWALPTHLPIAFVVYLKRKWIQQYFRIVFILSVLFAVCCWVLPQQFNSSVAPILGIILLRSYCRWKGR